MNGTNTKTGADCGILKVYSLEEKLKHRRRFKQGGSGGIFPRKFLKLQSWKCYFLRFHKAFSGNKQEGKCFRGREGYIFVSHHTIKFPTIR